MQFDQLSISQAFPVKSLYDGYVELYHKLLNNQHSLSKKDFRALKLKFRSFFKQSTLIIDATDSSSGMDSDTVTNTDTNTDTSTPNNLKFQKLYLKFFAFNCVLQTIPDNLVARSSKKKIPWIYGLVFPIQNFLSYRKFHRTVKKWGYSSIFEAYCLIFEVDSDETLKQMDHFLESSENEYKSLLKEHLPYLRPQTSSKTNIDDSPDSIFLNLQEKKRFYQGQWLSDKFRNADLNQTAKNLIRYFIDHGYLTEETVSILDQRIEITRTPHFFYNNITIPEINWENNSIKKFAIFNSIPRNTPYFQKTLVHELGHVITLSNLPKNSDIFTLLPFESAVNELGGEFFEILYFFPDFITKIYGIDEKSESEKIARYNRLYDLISKRFVAIQFKIYAHALQNPKFVKTNTKSVQNKFKTLIKEQLSLQPSNLKLFFPNIIHQLDLIRGLILIQEPFYQVCKNSDEKFLFYQSELKIFSNHLYTQPFNQIQKYFTSNKEKSSEIKITCFTH
ncbi:MAG: hypothetical protein ACTSYI_06400 [Promethearchaeota archaeon]